LSDAMRSRPSSAPRPLAWPAGRRLLYVVDVADAREAGLTVTLMQETPKREGAYDKPRALRISQWQVQQLPDPVDRRIIQLMTGTGRNGYGSFYEMPLEETFGVDESAYEDVLRMICATGRCRVRPSDGSGLVSVAWDDGPPWEFCLQVKPSPGGRWLVLDGSLRRPAPAVPVDAVPTADDDLPHDEDNYSPDEDLGGDEEGLLADDEDGVVPAETNRSAEEMNSGARPTTVGSDAEPGDVGFAKPQAAAAPGSAAPGMESPATLESTPPAPAGATPAPVEERFETVPLSEPHLLLHGVGDGFAFVGRQVTRLRDFDAFPLISALRAGEKISVPLNKQTDLLKMLLKFPRLPRLQLPPELEIAEVAPVPKPKLKLQSPGKGQHANGGGGGPKDALVAKVSFDYDGVILERSDQQAAVVINDGHTLLRRDGQREAMHLAELQALGFKEESNYFNNVRDIRLPLNKLPKAVGELTRRGWTVEADGKLYRSAGQMNVAVSSGIDWFELHGDVTFDGGLRATLPQLLSALRKGESVVRLDDGTFGLLPEEWLKKYAGLAGLGETDGDAIKFSSRQIGFLDALLSAMPEARFDETFGRARDELMRFGGVKAIDPPDTFVGTLRQYQMEGLGWMAFLRKFGFGGILADDMGLGKTVQVLALLEARRREAVALKATAEDAAKGQAAVDAGGNDGAAGNGQATANPVPATLRPHSPSLVVAPRSLVFNWKAEAEKFSPALRVLDHTAVDRVRSADHFRDFDLILTTYGTLRRDMSYFKDIRFDYAILDEAQAIKNASSESAKAARLVQADHRLALSGTPVQNHLGELWSLFDYLNPGMMGGVGVFRDMSADAANKDATARELLARSLRPFILRRTKEQVAKDLPEKLEQTLICELDKDQRKLYDELRDHYRTSLLDRVAKEGMNKAKIMVLEALLRLRQAACHPGLIDKTRSGEPSAKLEVLMDHLAELVDEGHKVLVFSQFTTLLGIVRQRLDKDGTVYEYLDGRTKDRQERVNRFQTDEACKLFLISLKAGGVGLNLTAAEYVFLLDPWWNPAVEAQAIDRAHRIGQTRRVFAYRLIAKDTVEEKVIQLQQSKKDLADAIINADNSLIRGLSREDLEMLLS
jgi:superfamily II DNA or RNA helicase